MCQCIIQFLQQNTSLHKTYKHKYMKQETFSTNKEAVQPITKHFKQQILPYELIVQTIAVQNKQLYELQKKYLQMQAEVSSLKYDSEREVEHLKTREDQRLLERKLFAEEALVCNEQKYEKQFTRKMKNQESQISLMKQTIIIDEKDSVNIFMSLEQGILNKLLEFAKSKKEQQSISQIKYWKYTFSEVKKKIQQSKQ